MGAGNEILDELRALRREVAALSAHLGVGTKPAPSGGSRDVEPADDAELDGKYGSPEIRKDPPAKYWAGEPMLGRRLSDCPAEYLDAFAKWKAASAYMKRKSPKGPDDAKYADYDERDARRAAGWAKRIRDGKHTPTVAATPAPAGAGDAWEGEGADGFDDPGIF